jgi:hypothetical protein
MPSRPAACIRPHKEDQRMLIAVAAFILARIVLMVVVSLRVFHP